MGSENENETRRTYHHTPEIVHAMGILAPDWNRVLRILDNDVHNEQARWVCSDGTTALLYACRYPDVPPLVVEKLLLANRAATRIEGGLLRSTPLNLACERGACNDVILLLLHADDTTAAIRDLPGRTPVQTAQRYGHWRIMLVIMMWAYQRVKFGYIERR